MSSKNSKELQERYLRKELLPTMFCPGCGNGMVLNYLIRALDALQVDLDELVLVSGIGCSSRLPAYIESDGLHTTHGRAIAFATGIKATNPDLTVIVITGDGDLASIGLSHFIHSIRRNIDLTVICINNFNYGMTGGQASATMPMGDISTTTPYQSIEHSFNLSELARAAGATYVARWTVAHSIPAINSIKKAITKKGLSFVEMLSTCPVSYGKWNISPDPSTMLRYLLENTIIFDPKKDYHLESAKSYEIDESCDLFEIIQSKTGKFLIGEFCDLTRADYHELYEQMKKRAKEAFWRQHRERNL
ncbi:MAG: thiamine pyrophosphate-dependent enzyme [Candidatus Helarchaeales archaeon]